ncbi:Uma2 family endonuclease [Microcoleus sp. FACHB-672]|uniref:Uma2 family endonuclease n=1 Tax=Microcoleus sp. FACHB-672 TaxID=2692825 RepID=UPI001688AFBA|nr:Uma2 family endonuclease [Microcoleus sp. FACHB-672]MBD2040813.1 Uma2 family endonuclease [Microcoleus sp. FACHB-672]
MSVQLLRRQFTVEEYHRMAEAGILTEDERVELIDGMIVHILPISPRHAACVKRFIRLFSQRLGDNSIVSVHNPVELSNQSEPQPDIALLQPRSDFYEAGHPQPKDIFLIVEVADTTVESDRQVKIPLYAGSGISEVWLVDINEQLIEIYRQPTAAGYQDIQKCRRGQRIAPQAFPEIQLAVDEVLG